MTECGRQQQWEKVSKYLIRKYSSQNSAKNLCFPYGDSEPLRDDRGREC